MMEIIPDSQVSLLRGTLQMLGLDVSVVIIKFSDLDESLYCYNVANIKS